MLPTCGAFSFNEERNLMKILEKLQKEQILSKKNYFTCFF